MTLPAKRRQDAGMTPTSPAASAIDVAVVEDDAACRIALVAAPNAAPDMRLLWAAATRAEALAALGDRMAQAPDVLLVDLGLPDGSGIDLIAEWRAADPALPILVISAWSTEDAILAALRAGATGYVLKERDDLEVSISIRSVLRGGAPIDPFIARRIIAELQLPGTAPTPSAAAAPAPLEEPLSAREQQILRLVADGMSNREIADALFLSRHTVECHVKHV